MTDTTIGDTVMQDTSTLQTESDWKQFFTEKLNQLHEAMSNLDDKADKAMLTGFYQEVICATGTANTTSDDLAKMREAFKELSWFHLLPRSTCDLCDCPVPPPSDSMEGATALGHLSKLISQHPQWSGESSGSVSNKDWRHHFLIEGTKHSISSVRERVGSGDLKGTQIPDYIIDNLFLPCECNLQGASISTIEDLQTLVIDLEREWWSKKKSSTSSTAVMLFDGQVVELLKKVAISLSDASADV